MTPSARFSTILADYLSSATALAISGVPSLTALPRRSLTSTGVIKPPYLLVHVEEDPDSADSLLTLKVQLRHFSTLGAAADNATLRATAHTQLQALRSLLADTDTAKTTWDIWIALQTTDYKTGWQLQQLWPQTTNEETDKDTNLLTLTAPYDLVTFWNA